MYYFRLLIIVSKTFCSVLKERENAIEEPIHVHDIDDLEGNYKLNLIQRLKFIRDTFNANKVNFLIDSASEKKKKILTFI